jgi:transmembrane sensor
VEKNNEHIESLITQELLGESTVEQQVELEGWRKAAEANERQYQSVLKTLLKTTDFLVGDETEVENIDIDAEWNHFKGSINQVQKDDEASVIPLQKTTWFQAAAAIIVLAIIGFAVLKIADSSENTTYYASNSGEELTLPDGSIIVLNANTEVSYPKSFTDKSSREISLKGEAFFEVEHNPDLPFIVHMTEADVEVLGTSFNISAYSSNPNINVVVTTGTVKLATRKESAEVILKAGDRGIYTRPNNQVIQEMNTDVNFLAWKTRQLVFEDMSLDVVIQTLNTLYDTNIIMTAESAENCQVTVSFDQQSLEAILEVLEAALDLTYVEHDDSIEIISTGC